MNDDDFAVVNAMIRYGGGFVRKLGEAACAADSTNLERLKIAFPNYWEQYAEYARLHAERMK